MKMDMNAFKKLNSDKQLNIMNCVKQMFTIDLKPVKVIANELNYSEKAIRKILKDWLHIDCKEYKYKSLAKTKLEKYGSSSYVNYEKAKQTKLEKYGSETYNNSEKAKCTNLEKYGVTSGWQTSNWKNSMINKYGSIHALQNIDCLNKMKNTRIQKYGCQFDKNKVIKTNIEKYNVPWYVMTDECRSSNGKTISNINRQLCKYFNYDESHLEHLGFDIVDDDKRIVIEIDPTYTHNSTIGPIFHNKKLPPKDYNYHINKTKKANYLNYHCIHIFDWDDIAKIKMIFFEDKEKISAHSCILKEITIKDSNEFLNKYHLQNSCKGNNINIGLYYNDELVSVATFGTPRYNNSYQYEFLRFASIKNIRGGIDKIWKYFISNYNPISVISYCDNSKFKGNFFKNIGFKIKNYGNPSKHWYNVKTRQHFTDNLLRQLGADKLLGTNYGKPEKCNMNNNEIMIKEGFVEIYDCGQSVYVWEK